MNQILTARLRHPLICAQAAGTKVWEWTDRVQRIHKDDVHTYLEKTYGKKRDRAVAVRQAFVLADDPDFLNCNPTDAGRSTNHNSKPTCGGADCVALRDIAPGDELTLDYASHGAPQWYAELCEDYGIMTEPELARSFVTVESIRALPAWQLVTVDHAFVRALRDGSLRGAAFRRWYEQDMSFGETIGRLLEKAIDVLKNLHFSEIF